MHVDTAEVQVHRREDGGVESMNLIVWLHTAREEPYAMP